jgi:hypothetical protein
MHVHGWDGAGMQTLKVHQSRLEREKEAAGRLAHEAKAAVGRKPTMVSLSKEHEQVQCGYDSGDVRQLGSEQSVNC